MKRSKEYLLWRDAVLERDVSCVICGAGPKHLNTHHLIPKNFLKYALDVDNGITLCPHHHTLGKWSAHKNPMWFVRWMRLYRNHQYALCLRRIKELSDEDNNI